MLVQKLRLQRGWSQQQLAELSGLSTRTIQRIENGQPASTETLKSLAAVFEVDFATLQPEPTMNDTNSRQADAAPEPPVPDPAVLEPAALEPAAHAGTTPQPPAAWSAGAEPPGGEGARPGRTAAGAAMSADEVLALRHVRDVRRFYSHALRYLVVVAILLAINYTQSPSRHWALWVVLGWGIVVAFHGARVFELLPFWRGDWERRQVEKRLGRPL